MVLINKFNTKVRIPREIQIPYLNIEITEMLYQNKLLVACNTPVKNRVIEGYQIIMTRDIRIVMNRQIYSKNWRYNVV